ncbi:MAG: sugar ABC transporter permease [Lachnospiraceae bacterium]|jgi:raffinose/stachyose/melibiose transport system permease protein|nr:sugar ABC transporter permease [Lachnospiraceae bacterium]
MDRMLRDKKTIILFMAPAILIFTLVIPIPLAASIGLSFFKWDLLSDAKFVGVKNFIRLFTSDRVFGTTVRNTFSYMLLSVLFQIPLAYCLSIFLTRGKRFEKLVRNTLFMPAVLSGTAVSLMFYFIYHPEVGLVNAVLRLMGKPELTRFWLADENTAMVCVCLAVAWQFVGYHMLIYVTGIIAIPLDIIEAAKIDGANVWQLALRVITPNMKPVLRVSLVLIMTSSFKSFDSIYVMTGGGPAHKTEVMASYMYNKAFLNLKYGYGCAVGLMLFVMCLVVSLAIQKILADR